MSSAVCSNWPPTNPLPPIRPVSLWRLTCQQPGLTAPMGIVQYKLRELSEEAARDLLWSRHPDWTVLRIEREETDTVPIRLGEVTAVERRPTS